MRIAVPILVLALGACASGPQAGAGYSDYHSYLKAREDQLTGTTQPSAGQPLSAAGGVPTSTPTDLSDEQNFEAVASRESIESDRARLEAQQSQYVAIAPQPLPGRMSVPTGPNIVSYALDTTNKPGEQVYRRVNPLRNLSHERACARFASADKAQEAFLAAGGPQRDSKNLDPDGDGFACEWNPAPFRLVAN
ncbi:excalibur calcium-binding domain-containing protein [Rhodovulum imhoffii]|uniref:Excalibur calcium-binding domain-containing protein n=1 Tax=Rhodovulum imhoffii TaxID=365340 RepID=A0A2T5BW27_9RHOB|nr:excalibur calcium-binding domain-containing protein [Rhodovulum imhoffii]PTN03846.1 excalibur calcium-binding domain-containing protein [Rhodovulum imhoffii]